MRITALFTAAGAVICALIFMNVGINPDITMQQVIIVGLMLATAFICLSHLER